MILMLLMVIISHIVFYSHDNLVREIEEEQERIAAELFQISEEIIEFKNRKNLQIEAIEVKIRDESQLTESMGTL
jgi:hypothetical protein